MWHVLLSYRYRPGTYQCFVSAEKKHPYCASVVYFLFSFKHRSHSNKPRSNKSLTHQVPKLDGGEPGLDDWPQAPKEVGCQGEPITQSLCYMPFFLYLSTVLSCTASCRVSLHHVLHLSSPVDLHVQPLLHFHLVLFTQVVKPWTGLAQIALNEVELRRETTSQHNDTHEHNQKERTSVF